MVFRNNMIGYIFSLVIIIFCLTFMFSLLLTAAVRSYASHRVLDIPIQRSSHAVSTPRGGGLAVGIVFLAMVVLLWILDDPPKSLAIAMIGGSLLVAVVGWIDDHRHVAARRRILMHFAAATRAIYWLDGFPSINIGHMVLPLGWAGHFLAIVGIVWMINLYNFMDGIDGLAAGEAVTVALVAAGLLWWKGAADIALLT